MDYCGTFHESVSLPVENVSTLKNFIRMKNGDAFIDVNVDTDNDDEDHFITDIEGETKTLRDIHRDDIIEITRSTDDSYINIILLNKKYSGTVESMESVDDYTEVSIDGEIYDCICSLDNIMLGEVVSFTLNTKNQIVEILV